MESIQKDTISEKFSLLQETEICKSYEDDFLDTYKLGEIFNCSPNTIRRILKGNNIRLRNRGECKKRFTLKIEKQICELYTTKNMSSYELGEKFDCYPSTILRILKRYNIERRDNKEKNNGMFGKRGENSSNWKGGISFEPYCVLFNKGFKERVRNFWDRKCGISGITEEENGRKLDVHHVNYDKQSCCNTTVPLFIPLSREYHTKTNHNRDYWEKMLTNYIMIWFNGECYEVKE
jgi:hypothetical protein